jgi:Y_Y_Y domain
LIDTECYGARRGKVSHDCSPKSKALKLRLRVFLRELRVRGTPYRMWDLGAGKVPNIDFGPRQNQLQISFAGLAFAPGEVLAYQYRLDPSDLDWSEPGDERVVNYSDLAPGTYRFRVRLITGRLVAGEPAELEFTIRAPFWQRWWFRLLLVVLAVGALYWLHRYRTMRILELERVRTHIATDLHDDIGSGLSQIAILSEVA